MNIYHVGFSKIETPDIHFGRKNADFGQGFYVSPNKDFAKKWGKKRNGLDTIFNEYFLDDTGLNIKTFERNEEWFNYITNNRQNKDDYLKEYDIIIGPIANDTIYDTYGALTSGMIPMDIVLKVLCAGPQYTQIVLKTQKAVDNLKFISSHVIPYEELLNNASSVRKEEIEYQEEMSKILEESGLFE